MVNNDNENNEEFEEITDELTDTIAPEITDIEDAEENKLKKLKVKLKQVEEEKRQALEELASVKADFLNARKRLEEDSQRTIERKTIRHMESLLPLADSFYMAMSNKEVWERGDKMWRKGVEGINAQLLQILKDNGVETIDPTGEVFDPALHEAIGTVAVDSGQVDTVIAVMQPGYTITIDGTTEILRPARVTTGISTEEA